ncbi:MAG TPA: tryptophan synthase subunit alpha [Pilimelia sp.]|nr:tryptophan synthase subunit alpha [Pilimelia sp.]
MSRIADGFAAASATGETALVAYLTAGYPHPDETVGLVRAAVTAGADLIELGVPFSDPMGDGPVIQESSRVALTAGTTLDTVLRLVAEIRREGVVVPVALMGYYNPFLRYGLKRLVEDATAAGVDGLVVPDLPAHQADELLDLAGRDGLDTVFFAAPGSRPERVAYTASRASGFLYCLATDGVTGMRDDLDPRLLEFLARVRAATALPLAVGFGISTPAHVRALRGHADGVIVGSALVRTMADASGPQARRAAVAKVVADLKAATRPAAPPR